MGHFVEQAAGFRGEAAAEIGEEEVVAEVSGGEKAELHGGAVDCAWVAAAAEEEGGEVVVHFCVASAAQPPRSRKV